jgi:uncharacterized protein (TIGR00730 family)
VYCGASSGKRDVYQQAAQDLAKTFQSQEWGLVYGGAHVGLMGLIADSVLNWGGEVIGIIPRSLQDKELAHQDLSELILCDSMHERKAIMEERSDAFIVLPGGIGTLDEFFEIWTWAQIGQHGKAVGVLNINGYYDHLIRHFDHMLAEGFLTDAARSFIYVEDNVEKLVKKLNQHQVEVFDRWH